MVNTFLLCSNIKKSMANIDSRRLGKQRVEAMQILHILIFANLIAIYYPEFKLPVPINSCAAHSKAFELYNTQDTILIYKISVMHAPSLKLKTLKDEKIDKTAKKEKHAVKIKKTDIKNPLLVDFPHKVSSAYCNHPMVLMWVGHVSGLKMYINLCIDEWVKRKYENKMHQYVLPKNVSMPWWIKCSAVHKSHCAALLRKEYVRKEPMWYWTRPWIADIAKTSWYKYGYVWLPHLSADIIARLKAGEDVDAKLVCDPIKNDFV